MKSSKSATVMKWIGYGTAVLSLIAGVREIEKVVSGRLEAARKIDALLSSEALQLKGQDYWSAWRSLEQASQIDPDAAKVHAAQETLAIGLRTSGCWRTRNSLTSQKSWSPC